MEEIINNYLKSNPNYGSKTINKLGSGFNGEAYLTDKNFVIKITKDLPEVKTASEISKKLNGVVTPKFFDIKKIDNNLYIIVMEKVTPITLTSDENIRLNQFRDNLFGLLKANKNILPLKDVIKGKLKNIKLENILSGLIEALAKLKGIGIMNADVHEDNIGFVGNKFVLFDVVDSRLVR